MTNQQNINAPDCVNLPSWMGYKPHMMGFIYDVMETQTWKDIPGYEGHYQINKFGLVKSLERTRFGANKSICKVKERILSLGQDAAGYLKNELSKNGIVKTHLVHRLVGVAFIPNPENKPEINHKNGIKFDCWGGNLEWVTCSENAIHAFRTGLKKGTMLGRFGKDHNCSKPVLQYDLQGIFIDEYGGMEDAQRKTGILSTSISRVCNNICKTAGGYKWKLKN